MDSKDKRGENACTNSAKQVGTSRAVTQEVEPTQCWQAPRSGGELLKARKRPEVEEDRLESRAAKESKSKTKTKSELESKEE